MLSNRPDKRPSAEDILEKTFLKARKECYLKENNFEFLKAQKYIQEYEDENIKKLENNKKKK